jgi:hypothetical protein
LDPKLISVDVDYLDRDWIGSDPAISKAIIIVPQDEYKWQETLNNREAELAKLQADRGVNPDPSPIQSTIKEKEESIQGAWHKKLLNLEIIEIIPRERLQGHAKSPNSVTNGGTPIHINTSRGINSNQPHRQIKINEGESRKEKLGDLQDSSCFDASMVAIQDNVHQQLS